jgi:predicted Rdx family selenoprotein
LAADIKKILGIKATLMEGHGGIFEVSLKDKLIYSNKRECSQPFAPAKIIKDIGRAVTSGNL